MFSNPHLITKLLIILIQKSRQVAHITEFILSDDCSTCFGYHCHPSSGAQKTVTTASDNRYTVLLSAAIVEELELVWVFCGWRIHATHRTQPVQFTLILVLKVSIKTKKTLSCPQRNARDWGTPRKACVRLYPAPHYFQCELSARSWCPIRDLNARTRTAGHRRNCLLDASHCKQCVRCWLQCLRTAPVGSNEVVENIWIIIDVGMGFRFLVSSSFEDPGYMIMRRLVCEYYLELDRVRLWGGVSLAVVDNWTRNII